MHVSRRVDTFSNSINNGSKALNTTEGETFHALRGGFGRECRVRTEAVQEGR